MRVAALYDIHGNLPALEAVLDEIARREVEQVIVGGDVVPGPMPRECIDLLRSLPMPVQFIRGNGDREVLAFRRGEESPAVPEAFREAMRWNARQLRTEDLELLGSWPTTLRLFLPRLGDALFCHATPRNDFEIFTRLTAEERLVQVFKEAHDSLVVCGHTHIQFERTVGAVRTVNAGSVGMPFGEPGAYWLMLDETVELRRTDYNTADAAERIRLTSYPGAADFAERYVEHPPSEEEMLKVFAAAELQ